MTALDAKSISSSMIIKNKCLIRFHAEQGKRENDLFFMEKAA